MSKPHGALAVTSFWSGSSVFFCRLKASLRASSFDVAGQTFERDLDIRIDAGARDRRVGLPSGMGRSHGRDLRLDPTRARQGRPHSAVVISIDMIRINERGVFVLGQPLEDLGRELRGGLGLIRHRPQDPLEFGPSTYRRSARSRWAWRSYPTASQG